ncbi:hypothetical protein Cni_G28991 [Canna indica]|uniref:RWP-RK domain-containing protein n=1 Tax=Canna indica TaxID=4628 RepID=A0AAQ3QT18_9LILI|nr:hypothetical protein Cni_G28991 [Canna indica]
MDELRRYFRDDDEILPYLDFSDQQPPIVFSMIEGLPDGSSSNVNEDVDPVFVQFMPGQLDCSRCLLFRELIHSNGYQNVKVLVHGEPPHFSHAIFEIERPGKTGQKPTVDHYLINLESKDGGWVAGFLNIYTLLLDTDNSVVIQDTVSPIYTTLCGEVEDYSIVNQWLQIPPEEDSDCQRSETTSQCTDGEQFDDDMPGKSRHALQREKTRKITLKDLANHFHMPLADAAKKLELCSTALKLACRRHGVMRWPCRQIKSIDRQIQKLERQMANVTREALRAETRVEIELLKHKKRRLYGLDK